MDAPWNRRGPGREGRVDRARRRSRHTIEFLTLEGRSLQAVGSVTAVVDPKILTPNHGEGLTVTVSGTVQQVLTDTLALGVTSLTDDQYNADVAVNVAKPIPSQVNVFVTDQYRQVEPRAQSTVDPTVVTAKSFFRPTPKFTHFPPAVITVRTFHYSIPLKLQAKASHIGRQYDVTVFATDTDGGSEVTTFAYVPYRARTTPRTR